jgi:hypothetical protein
MDHRLLLEADIFTHCLALRVPPTPVLPTLPQNIAKHMGEEKIKKFVNWVCRMCPTVQ